MAAPLARSGRLFIQRTCAASSSRLGPASLIPSYGPSLLATRSYAKKSKKASSSSSRQDDDSDSTMVIKTKGKASRKSTSFVSASTFSRRGGEEPIDASESAVDEVESVQLDKARGRMDRAVERFQGQAYDGVERGKGRVTPALLDSVRVQLVPDEALEPLQSVASVTVRNATLFVEVYDADSLKHVESAINKANLPGISPQRHDDRTLKIPIARPTQDVRDAITKDLHTALETAKQHIRGARTDALKAYTGAMGKAADKKDPFHRDIQDLTDKHTARLDELMAQVRKEFAKV